MSKEERCPNCDQQVKGFWASKPNRLFSEFEVKYINSVLNREAPGYCQLCGSDLLQQSRDELNKELKTVKEFIRLNITKIKILTTHTPYAWQYVPISIVTGQSVTGTGFMSEFKSDFTDFFGGQSGSFNKKLADGELLCFAQMRSKAIELGANAIIATDVDYGDVGEGKGMLMVCAAGTAIKVINDEVLGPDASITNVLSDMAAKLKYLNNIKEIENKIESLI